MLWLFLSAYSISIVLCENVPADIACLEAPSLCKRVRQVESVVEAQSQFILQLQVQLSHQSHQLHQQQTALDDIAAARLADKAEIHSLTKTIATFLNGITNTRLSHILTPPTDAAGSRSVNARSDDGGPLEAVVNQMGQQLTAMSADIQAMKNAVPLLQNVNQQQDQNIQDARTSTFVHWGSSQCPSDSQLVYSGIIGGSLWTHSGAATNTLCLTMSPVPGPGVSLLYWAYVFGAEYETWDSTHHDKDPVCAVCRARHATTIMIPGTNVCSQGWTKQYDGYLMAGEYDHVAGTEYICVDTNLQSRPGSENNRNGLLLYYTVTQCGSLPCGPYVNNTIVLCAVCSQ